MNEWCTGKPVAEGTRIAFGNSGHEAGHCYIYILKNQPHEAPFALIEGMEIKREYRRRGSIQSGLLAVALKMARAEGCNMVFVAHRKGGGLSLRCFGESGFKERGTAFWANPW